MNPNGHATYWERIQVKEVIEGDHVSFAVGLNNAMVRGTVVGVQLPDRYHRNVVLLMVVGERDESTLQQFIHASDLNVWRLRESEENRKARLRQSMPTFEQE